MSNKTESENPHIVPLRTYLGVGLTLYFLTIITIVVAQIELGGLNIVVALSIAGIKALMVALIYMHLRYDKKILLIIFITAILFLVIFISFTMLDTAYRGQINAITEKPIDRSAIIYKTDTDTIRVIDSARGTSENMADTTR